MDESFFFNLFKTGENGQNPSLLAVERPQMVALLMEQLSGIQKAKTTTI